MIQGTKLTFNKKINHVLEFPQNNLRITIQFFAKIFA